jgi:hypothetical protein
VVIGLMGGAAGVLLLLAAVMPRPATLPDPVSPRVRMLSRLLFTRNQAEGFTLDCLVVSVEESGGINPPTGQPFTLQLRAPETAWFAERVEHLLAEWADESRELLVELSEDHGKVRTMLASNGSSVHLELCGAAGLRLSST